MSTSQLDLLSLLASPGASSAPATLAPGAGEAAVGAAVVGSGRGRRRKATGGEASAAAVGLIETMAGDTGAGPGGEVAGAGLDPAAPQAALAVGSAAVESGPAAAPALAEPAAMRTADRVIVFDVETTGTDRRRDQIIELCVQFGLGDDAPSRVWRFKPSVSISPGAQAVHGISMDDLSACPSFADHAAEVRALIDETAVLVGYNLAFDIDMLQAEYERLGQPLIDVSRKTIVDPFRLWQQCEPRSLQHAHQRFVGAGFAAAHSASADVAATGRVLRGMLATFGLADRDWNDIAGVCDPQRDQRAAWLGPSKHFVWEGEVVALGFGKHAGTIVHEMAKADPGYLRWMLDKDFPVHVHEVCKAALERGSADFLRWARERYPSTAPVSAPVPASASAPVAPVAPVAP
ncbi:MAG: hypothetical protein KBG28_01015 [Kofleriaceae bacterium]|nr:hypothetical protein [Kofleriaceae bacterium]